MSTTPNAATPATTVNKTFDQMLADNLTASDKLKGQTIVLIVKGVSDWKPTANKGLARKMVLTDKGTFWMLASNITNLPTSFTQPVQATAVISQNGQWLNMDKLQFAGLATEIVLGIRELGVGRALFATAADLKLAI